MKKAIAIKPIVIIHAPYKEPKGFIWVKIKIDK